MRTKRSNRLAWRIAALALATPSLGSCVDGEVDVTHYADGPTWSTRMFLDGEPNSAWVIWYHQKTPRFAGRYNRGARVDTWYTTGTDGGVRFRRSYDDDRPSGEWKRFYADGSPLSEGQFEGGRKSGVWKRWHPNGQLAEEATWLEGHYAGPVRRFDAGGVLVQELVFALDGTAPEASAPDTGR